MFVCLACRDRCCFVGHSLLAYLCFVYSYNNLGPYNTTYLDHHHYDLIIVRYERHALARRNLARAVAERQKAAWADARRDALDELVGVCV